MSDTASPFGEWLTATMRSRDLSQAALARTVGVADAQVSRWRRGQVVPSVRHLQRLAEALDVPRVGLDRLAGYPTADGGDGVEAGDPDPARQAELATYRARFGQTLERTVPRHLWRAYAEACEALAEAMGASYDEAVAAGRDVSTARPGGAVGFAPPGRVRQSIGFRR